MTLMTPTFYAAPTLAVMQALMGFPPVDQFPERHLIGLICLGNIMNVLQSREFSGRDDNSVAHAHICRMQIYLVSSSTK